MAGFWHAPPARAFAPHLRPGQPGPKRVALPAWINSAWLTLFTIYFRRSRGWAFNHRSGSPFEGVNPVPWTEHPGPRPIARGPQDTPHRRLSCHAFGELAEWLGDKKMGHVRGAPYHPQTQGKIERWHQTLKNRILLENYFFPADLEARIEAFVDHYNHQRYHESINNLTPADVYFGRGQSILKQRERIKLKTMENRRLQYRKYAA